MKTKFGKIKVLAHRMLKGECIPIFNDRKANREIEAHIDRIMKAKTKKK